MYMEPTCGRTILPCSPEYPAARQIFNRSIQRYPAAITYCETANEVNSAVCHALSHGQTIRVRSGGHNYEGYCIGDNVPVIDVSPLKFTVLNNSANTAVIGSGINNRELYEFLDQYRIPFPSGTCPTVSAAGITQGGGWGRSARTYGLTCDMLTQAELIDAKGRLLVANSHSHPDLFWALRGGGGGNFGVVTSLSYRLPAPVDYVTYVILRYPGADKQTAHQFFRTWQEWVRGDEFRFTPNTRIYNSERDGMGITMRGFFYGSPEETEAALQPFTEIDGAQFSLQYVTFGEATQIDASTYSESEQFRFAGRFSHRLYTDKEIGQILDLIRSRADGATYCSVALYAMGGRIRDKSPGETAFFYRNADYIMGLDTQWEDPAAKPASLQWLARRFGCLRSLTCGSYINFPYLPTTDYMNAYYGGNARRLAEVKMKYDPDNVFCFEQAIQ